MGTRLFFVTDSKEENEEIFSVKSQAYAHFNGMNTGTGRRIRICMVRNYWRDGNKWNYDDLSDTFETVKILEQE